MSKIIIGGVEHFCSQFQFVSENQSFCFFVTKVSKLKRKISHISEKFYKFSFIIGFIVSKYDNVHYAFYILFNLDERKFDKKLNSNIFSIVCKSMEVDVFFLVFSYVYRGSRVP